MLFFFCFFFDVVVKIVRVDIHVLENLQKFKVEEQSTAVCMIQNQNQNSLLVIHQQTFIHQGQRMRGLVHRSHQ